jgi:hypothetical protein
MRYDRARFSHHYPLRADLVSAQGGDKSIRNKLRGIMATRREDAFFATPMS